MTRMSSLKRVAVITALTAAVTFGISTNGRAQSAPDFNGFLPPCLAPLDASIAVPFCSPVWKLPLGVLEVGFGNNGVITYDVNQQLSLFANMTAVYFDLHGDADQLSSDPARMASTSVVLRAKVGTDGKFIPGGGGGACGVGTFDDFCVMGRVTTASGVVYGGSGQPLLRGRIERMTKAPNAVTHGVPYDDFEFYINITGGDLFVPFYWSRGYTHSVVEAFGYNPPELRPDGSPDPGHVTWSGDNPFGQPFAEYFVEGYSFLTVNDTGGLFDPCNGQISGFVTDYFAPLSGIPGAEVQVTGQTNIVPGANGAYATSANLCAGPYTVSGLAPAGYTVYGASSQNVQINTVGAQNSVVSNVNFKMYSSPISTSAYTTFGQGHWGTKPRGQNAGQLLATYFNFLYPTGELVIGIPNTAGRFTVTETGAAGVQDFLPQEGRPMPLTGNYIDPPSRFKIQHKGKYVHHRRLGSLAGETLALELNVRFSAYSLTRYGLGGLKVASGKLAGQTVDQVLALANRVLGGDPLPAIFKNYDELEDIVERINKNFQAGTTNNGYLIP